MLANAQGRADECGRSGITLVRARGKTGRVCRQVWTTTRDRIVVHGGLLSV